MTVPYTLVSFFSKAARRDQLLAALNQNIKDFKPDQKEVVGEGIVRDLIENFMLDDVAINSVVSAIPSLEKKSLEAAKHFAAHVSDEAWLVHRAYWPKRDRQDNSICISMDAYRLSEKTANTWRELAEKHSNAQSAWGLTLSAGYAIKRENAGEHIKKQALSLLNFAHHHGDKHIVLPREERAEREPHIRFG